MLPNLKHLTSPYKEKLIHPAYDSERAPSELMQEKS